MLLLRYRLAPKHPYPAALDDVLDAHQALLDRGTPPGRIVLVGHSAGATLTLSALLALRQAGRCPPGRGHLPHHRLHLLRRLHGFQRGQRPRRELEQTRAAYLGDTDPATAPASPLADVPDGLPPPLIACGDGEVFRDDATRFAQAADDAKGAEVELDIFQGMPHGFPCSPWRRPAPFWTGGRIHE